MSLILEALKKSEAQRRFGEVPNLGTPISATRPRRRPLPKAVFAAILILGATGTGWYLHQAAPPIPAPMAGEETPIRVTAAPPSAPARAPKPLTTTPAAATAAPATAAAPVPRKETPPPALADAAPALPPLDAAALASPTPAPAPVVSDVPMVNDMPPDVRSALPALPITMQVYSPDPKHRFVIIDGTHVVEGDSVHGVTVQEIRPTGLVLDFHGRRMLLPRPGS